MKTSCRRIEIDCVPRSSPIARPPDRGLDGRRMGIFRDGAEQDLLPAVELAPGIFPTAGGGDRALDPALTVKAAGLSALDRVDVVPEK